MSTSTREYPLVSLFSLSKVDAIWSQILERSTVVLVCNQAGKRLSFFINSLSRWPTQLSTALKACAEFLSSILALFLLAVLPLPQFAADKEGLAVLAALGIALFMLSRLIAYKSGASNTSTIHSSAVEMLVLAFLCTNIASTFSSHYFQTSLIGLAKVLVYVGSYFWFTAVIATSRKKSVIAVSILLASGLATALYGLYQYQTGVEPLATWEDPNIVQKTTRIYSTLGNPNLLAGYLTPLAPLAAALGFMMFFKARYLLSIIPFVVAVILSIAIVLTGSRGAYIAFFAWLTFLFVIICGYAMKTRRIPRLYLLLFAASLAIALLSGVHFLPSIGQRIASIFAGSEHSSNAFRLNVWRASLRMFLDNWWLGIGPGNKTFILAYGLYMFSGFDALGTYCVPLEIAVETGLPGLLVFGCLFICLVSRAHLVFRAADNDLDRWLSVGCAAALWGIVVHGLVDTVFFRPQVQFVFWLFAALIASAFKRSSHTLGLNVKI